MVLVAEQVPPRFEFKYALTNRQAERVRDAVAPYCVLDQHCAALPSRQYTISSLYFDTPHLGFHWAKELAIQDRFKLRARSYGPGTPVFFEIKRKVDDLIVKSRAVVPAEGWRGRITGAVPADASAAERGFRALFDRHRCRPVILCQYDREAWLSLMDAYARVTFDRRLLFQPMDTFDVVGAPRLFQSEDDPTAFDEPTSMVILELKFNREVPRWLAGVPRRFGLERIAFSKYSTGITRLFGRDHRVDAANREAARRELEG